MNYKFLNVPLGMELHSQDHKYIWGAVAAAGASILGNLIGNSQQAGFTKEQQRLQSKLNREEQAHSMALQQNYQNMLWNEGAGKQVSGMKNAGLNPATVGGTVVGGAGGSVGHPSSGASGPSASKGPSYGSEAVAAAMQSKQVENETKVADAQSEALLAQAEKDRQSATGQKNINDNFKATWEKEMQMRDSEISRNNASAEESYKHAALYGKQAVTEEKMAQKLQAEVDEVYARTNVLRQELKNKATERYVMLRDLKERCLTAAQQRLGIHSEILKREVDAYCEYIAAENESAKTYWQSELARLDVEFRDNYERWEHRFKVVKGFTGVVGDIVVGVAAGSITKLAGAGKAVLRKFGK